MSVRGDVEIFRGPRNQQVANAAAAEIRAVAAAMQAVENLEDVFRDPPARDRMGGAVDYEITGTLHDVIANDDHTIALVDATATRGGKTLTYRTAEIYHIRDGKVAERWAFSDDTAAITAFFA